MRVTIRAFVAALESPSDNLRTLRGALAMRASDGTVRVSRTKHFADAYLSLDGQRYMLSMPLDESALMAAKSQAVRLRSLSSPSLCRYEVLLGEMSVTSGNRLLDIDVVLHHLPQGELLSDIISELDTERLYTAVGELYAELKSLDIVHSALRADNIIITEDYRLVLLRYNYSTSFDAHSAERDFTSLCNWIEQQRDVPTPLELCFSNAKQVEYPSLESYEWRSNFFEGLCLVRRNGLYGYVDLDARVVIEPQYIWANDMQEGRAEVTTANGMGLIDARGEYIIEPRYEIVEYELSSNIIMVRQDDLWSRFDYNGRQISEFAPMQELALVM